MTLYELLNSRRDILALPEADRLAAVKAAAWTATKPVLFVNYQTFTNGVPGSHPNLDPLTDVESVSLIGFLEQITAIPDDPTGGKFAVFSTNRQFMRVGDGVDITRPKTFAFFEALSQAATAAGATAVVSALNKLRGWAWSFNAELGNATLEQVAEAAAKVALADEAAGLIEWARSWYEQVRVDVGTGLTAGTVPTKATLKDGLVV
jgi:hypothetical protein